MDLMKMGSQLLASKLGGGGDAGGDAIQSALGSLIGGGGGGLDLGSLVGKLQEGGMADMAQSWLGDGENEAISTDQVKSLFGADKISEAASQLGTDEGSVLSGLQEMLPQMVDKSSSNGSLLDLGGAAGGAMDMMKKFT